MILTLNAPCAFKRHQDCLGFCGNPGQRVCDCRCHGKNWGGEVSSVIHRVYPRRAKPLQKCPDCYALVTTFRTHKCVQLPVRSELDLRKVGDNRRGAENGKRAKLVTCDTCHRILSNTRNRVHECTRKRRSRK